MGVVSFTNLVDTDVTFHRPPAFLGMTMNRLVIWLQKTSVASCFPLGAVPSAEETCTPPTQAPPPLSHVQAGFILTTYFTCRNALYIGKSKNVYTASSLSREIHSWTYEGTIYYCSPNDIAVRIIEQGGQIYEIK